MIIINLHNKFYQHPTCWNELTEKKLIACLDTLENNWNDDRKRLYLFKILAGVSSVRFWFCDVALMQEYFYLQHFLIEQNELTKNLITRFNGLYGPADNFSNLVVSEYIFSESHYTLFKEHGSIVDLNCLVAVLYRPRKKFYNHKKNSEGDVRFPFNDNLISYYERRVSNWPLKVKMAILHWYEGCRRQLQLSYPDVFGGTGSPAKRGILSIAVSMAEAGPFGDFEKIEKLLLHTFMIGISEQMEKAKQLPK